jgi:hypothetical protein
MRSTIPGTLLKKLHLILHRGFVEARELARRRACEQLHDLADTFEILPTLIDVWEEAHFGRVRGMLRQYQENFPETAYDYLSVLDMAEASFSEVFGAQDDSELSAHARRD